jgi:ADP-ribosylglycohydrolase
MSDFLENLAAGCPASTPFRFLRFTWFGDYACSSGEHYFPGGKISFEDALKVVNKECSDDLIENLACWIMKDSLPHEATPAIWRRLSFDLYELIKGDYDPDPVRYSPEYADLFAAKDEKAYLAVTARTSNCGGAMRSASLAFAGASELEHRALVGMTHMHPEAMAGAYALFQAVKALIAGGGVDDMWEAAIAGGKKGEAEATTLLDEWGHLSPGCEFTPWLGNVRKHQDARHGMTDWHAQGISTRFVVSGALQIASKAIPLGPEKALRHVIEQGLEIGGDPDTLGSMGMALIGAKFGEELHKEMDRVIKEMIPPEDIDIPSFFAVKS